MPGETVDIELANPQDQVLQGMVENRDLDIGGGMRTRRSVEADYGKAVEEIAKAEQELYALRKRQNELEAQLNAPRFANDPKFRSDRAAAMAAGHAPGYSDGPLPGAEPGPESEDALKRMHIDPKAAAEADPAQGGVDARPLRPAAPSPSTAQPERSSQPESPKGPVRK